MVSYPYMQLNERLAGGLIGLLVGDALGVPYEFYKPENLPSNAEIEFCPPAGFRRAHQGTPPGTWSDDGALALCLLASLLDRSGFDADDFGSRVCDWYENGYLAVDDRVFDVGITTSAAIHAMRSGTPAALAGAADQHNNGNGSLMRALPLALWHRGTDEELARDAMAQSRVTHGHLRSQLCCALHCLWARREIEGVSNPWERASQSVRDIVAHDQAATAELEFSIRPDREPHGSGSGYVVDSLHSARLALVQTDFEQVVVAAVKMGNDTDTTACIAGGIAGIRHGREGIPLRWRQALRGRELYEPLLEGLMGRG